MAELTKHAEAYVLEFEDSVKNRFLMKTNLFLDGLKDIEYERESNTFSIRFRSSDEYVIAANLNKLVFFLKKNRIELTLCDEIEQLLLEKEKQDDERDSVREQLIELKANPSCSNDDYKSFCDYCDSVLNITLRDYQYKSAYLLSLGNGGFDFSVPGAGKTIITYSAYAHLKHKGVVDRILVIGPGSAYNAWFEEYVTCFNEEPSFINLASESSEECKIYLCASRKYHTEITFINFEKLRRIRKEMGTFLAKGQVLLIVDEAHKVKNPNAEVTKSILDFTAEASARIILTGTPMPNGYEDLSSLYEIFSPSVPILPFKYSQLKNFTAKGASERDIARIKDAIEPYYSRISKKYLVSIGELDQPEFKVVKCEMDAHQYELYERLNSFSRTVSDDCDEDLLVYLKKAILIRKMQISANPSLLKNSIVSSMDELKEEYLLSYGGDVSDINLLAKADKEINDRILGSAIANIVSMYSRGTVETSKNLKAVELCGKLIEQGKQVLIWDVFVSNMEVLADMILSKLRVNVEIVNGKVTGEERQNAIARFRSGESKVLIANPSTLAESISLHKVCQHAIYVNVNFNAAQFIQSKDRIHRINMPEGTTATYYFLENEETVDEAIYERLIKKEKRMLEILDSDDLKIGGSEMENRSIMSDEDIDIAYMR